MKKYRGKIITIQRVKNIVHSILDEQYTDKKAYKIIYFLKTKGYAQSIKKDILLCKYPEDSFDESDIIEKHYRDTTKKHCKDSCGSQWYIGGLKALELNINNYDTWEEIEIYNKDKNATEIAILDRKIIFKTYTQRKKNLRSTFRKHTHKLSIEGHTLPVAKLELALLESLYNPQLLQKKYTEELVKKIIRKYKKQLDLSIITAILQSGKHHTSSNRLYQLAKGIDENIANEIADSIKRYSFIMPSNV